MRSNHLVALLALSAFAAPARAQAPILYIDPVNGADAPGNGGPTSPLRTMTFAIGLVGLTGPVTLRLRAGVYTTPGETFPMPLPDFCVIEADPTVPRPPNSVVIDGQPFAYRAALEVGGRGTPVDVTLRGLFIQGAIYRAVDINGPGGTGTLRFAAEGCVMEHYRDLAVITGGNTVANISAINCNLRGLDEQVRITARGTSSVSLTIDRGTVGGGWIGTDLISEGGIITPLYRGVRFNDCGLNGVRMATNNNGIIALRAEHCLFRDNGNRFVGGPTTDLGAITDDPSAVAGTRLVTVENSIFSGNANDCPHWAPTSYTFGVNIVQQPNLGGIGGNFIAGPQFAEVRRNDFHLLPGSPAIDRGVASATTLALDFEGDPRVNGAAPDLGPDEFHGLYLYTQGAFNVGGPFPTTITFKGLAPAGTGFVTFVAPSIQPGLPWGPGVVHLLPPIIGPIAAGVTQPTGLGLAALTLPVDRGLIGVDLWWQGVFTVAPFLSANAHRTLLRE